MKLDGAEIKFIRSICKFSDHDDHDEHSAMRMPKYTVSRFFDADEVKDVRGAKTWIKNMKSFPNTRIWDYDLTRLARGEGFLDPKLKFLTSNTYKKSIHQHSKVRNPFCSPWLSKLKPISSTKAHDDPVGGTIYSSVEMYYKEPRDNYVFVQENKDTFRYMPLWMVATGTVAFPRVKENEIWTVGWVQAVKNESLVQSTYKNSNDVKRLLALLCIKN